MIRQNTKASTDREIFRINQTAVAVNNDAVFLIGGSDNQILIDLSVDIADNAVALVNRLSGSSSGRATWTSSRRL